MPHRWRQIRVHGHGTNRWLYLRLEREDQTKEKPLPQKLRCQKPHSLEGVFFLVIYSDVIGDHGLLHPQIDVECDEAIEGRIRAGQYKLHPLPPQPLDPLETISDVWPRSPPHDHLQVFITLPTGLSPPIPKTAGELRSL